MWIDSRLGVERSIAPGQHGAPLYSGWQGTLIGDSATPAPPGFHALARWQHAFDPWAVVAEWSARRDASVAARYPLSAMRTVEGRKDRLRTVSMGGVSGTTVMSADSGADLARARQWPAMTDSIVVPPQPFWTGVAPDTVRVGAHSFLLVNASFASAVALAADTVWVLDAAQGEGRARQDSAWIGRLFPGKHPVVFVAETGIWPHIAGLRYWVANGASVVTHPSTLPLVTRALARR